MNNADLLSERRLSYCGCTIVDERLIRTVYDPNSNSYEKGERLSQSIDLQEDDMLYDPMDIGTDLCK